MSLSGMIFGALIGLLVTRALWGAVIGAIIGHLFSQSLNIGGATGGARQSMSTSDEFFRSTFELMGHVAKSDGRVSEAEIGAARQLMEELSLGPNATALAMDYFRTGKGAAYNVETGIERLREACGQRHDLLRAFMELQLRAALAGSGISPSARFILTRVAERLGMSALEFAYMEASMRARQAQDAAGHRPVGSAQSLSDWYAELEIDKNISDQEVTKAYRRQMSRHHPDKLVANGLPESMAQVAKEKTQRIQEAYEGIRAARGMR